jgi:hypothetical protein
MSTIQAPVYYCIFKQMYIIRTLYAYSENPVQLHNILLEENLT